MHFHLLSLSTRNRLKMTEHFLVASIDLFTSSSSAGFIVFYRQHVKDKSPVLNMFSLENVF